MAQEFLRIDTSGKGELNREEFKAVLLPKLAASVCCTTRPDEPSSTTSGQPQTQLLMEVLADQIFKSLDVDESGGVNVTKFVAGCLDRSASTRS